VRRFDYFMMMPRLRCGRDRVAFTYTDSQAAITNIRDFVAFPPRSWDDAAPERAFEDAHGNTDDAFRQL
jgi:uncharacterized protein (DUF427 family)